LGAGPTGIVASLFLAKAGYDVDLYEGRQDPRIAPPPTGRSINLTLSSRGWAALEELDLLAVLQPSSMPLIGRTHHLPNGATEFQAYGPNGETLGAIPRSELNGLLLEAASKQSRIRKFFNHRCVDVDIERRTLRFERAESGRLIEVAAEHVVAADGAYSIVRRQMLTSPGFEVVHEYAPYAYREARLPPADTGGSALRPDTIHLWHRGDMLVVAIPNRDHSFNTTILLPIEGGNSFRQLRTRSAVEAFFDANFPDLGPLIPNIAGEIFGRPFAMVSCISSPSLVHAGYIALVGDSAHTTDPTLGQGMNAGFEDCSVLHACLQACSGDWGSALRSYQRKRCDDAEAIVRLSSEAFGALDVSRDKHFFLRRRIEGRLYAKHPDSYIPSYNMISFTNLPYNEVARRQANEQALVARALSILHQAGVPATDEAIDRAITRAIQRATLTSHPAMSHSAALVARERSQPCAK
jgi:kynurenine 3-monooxygenase